MSKISELFTEFSTLSANSNRKCVIINELSGGADSRINKFLIDIIRDIEEFDLARIEALQTLSVRELDDQEERQAASVVANVIQDVGDDIIVRQWAADVSWRFIKYSEIMDAIRARILDGNENSALRHNLLASLESEDGGVEKIAILRALLSDTDETLLGSAQRLLQQWGESGDEPET